jgi:hypothetical protein
MGRELCGTTGRRRCGATAWERFFDEKTAEWIVNARASIVTQMQYADTERREKTDGRFFFL